MEVAKQTLLIGGLPVDVYSHPTSSSSSTNPIHALFFLHGRFDSAQDKYIADIVKVIFDESYAGGERKKDLIVVAFVSRSPYL
jgi:hypothetical protein